MTPAPDILWTIVLAAGEGRRLLPLTRALHGENVPKQFAGIEAGRSLLQSTLARVAGWSHPQRTLVVVAREREWLARSHILAHGPIRLVLQPVDRGTGPGILLPLTWIAAREPGARVVIVPSDHFVRDAAAFVAAVWRAAEAASAGDSVVLIGAAPDRPETQYGWIVPGPSDADSTSHPICRFHEKPSARMATSLLKEGALWNTFVMTGAVERFRALAARHLPGHWPLFELYRLAIGTGSEAEVLSRIYDRMPRADFSREVLEAAEGLEVVTLAPCGWSDWGTPERVFESLAGSPDLASLLDRVGDMHTRALTPSADAGLDDSLANPAQRIGIPETLIEIGGKSS